MESELTDFISHLDDDVQFSPYPQLNEMWRELEDYFDRSYFDIDAYLDELLPNAQPTLTTVEYDESIMEPTKAITTEELLQSFAFAIPETFFNELISVPPVVADRCLVTDEILLQSVRSTDFVFSGRRIEHRYESLLTADFVSIASRRSDFETETGAAEVSPLIVVDIDWISLLQNKRVYPGVTAEELAESVLQSKSLKLPTHTEIVNVINRLFKELNEYIDSLSAEFEDHRFFDSPQLDAIALKLQGKMLSKFNADSAAMRDVLRKWMGTVTDTFVHINDERRLIEEKVSKKIIDRAVEIFRDRVLPLKLNEKMSATAVQQQSEIVSQGIRHIYSDCGVDFTENVLKELKKRLTDEHLDTREATRAPTTPTTKVLIDWLVSEYAGNINQKGLQCAGISTLEQFNDVNATCLRDIQQTFARKMNGVAVAERSELQKQLNSKLEAESNSKRSEFKSAKVSTSPSAGFRISAAHSLAASQAVGIHFGFETISVSCFNRTDNGIRTIFGPVANVVSFVPGGAVSIGPIPNDGISLNMADLLLTNKDVDAPHDTKYHGKMRLDSIVALMLMHVDELVKKSLHTMARVRYAVAIPSCLNEAMQHIFKTAFHIADLNCSLLREQCALTANFMRENHQAVTKNNDEFIITMIVTEDKACDSVVYKIAGTERSSKTMKVLSADGSAAKSQYLGFRYSSGLKCELDKMKDKSRSKTRFLICCSDQNDAVQEIKNQFNKSKVHPLKFDSKKVADGAALLSYAPIDTNSIVGGSINLNDIASIKRLAAGGYRLKHQSCNAERRNIRDLATKLRLIVDKQLKQLVESRADAKQFIMGKIKDLEESRFAVGRKEPLRRSLEKDLRAVDEEATNQFVIQNIVDKWKEVQF